MDSLTQAMMTRISVLEERVRQLEDALCPPTVVILPEWGLTALEAKVFAHLTTVDVASKEQLMAACYDLRHDDEIPEKKIIDVCICKMRKKITAFGIEIQTVWGQGYSLANRALFAPGQSAAPAHGDSAGAA